MDSSDSFSSKMIHRLIEISRMMTQVQGEMDISRFIFLEVVSSVMMIKRAGKYAISGKC
ncbi:hypothetical protein ACM1RC_29275 [Paenibacillus azoreducens]|uniref:hypothetical protein n=1 Tax=Paenibacillus azoreducens TaxID=116718 RepID=UPI0039F54484